jgi:hypothetical protein
VGEANWRKPLELRNVPFYACDLNFLDVVEAVSESETSNPRFVA